MRETERVPWAVVVVVIGVALAVLVAGGCTSSSTSSPSSAPSSNAVAPGTGPSDTTAGATAARSAPTAELRMVSLNMLHGLPFPIGQCAESSDFCRADDRLQILFRLIEEAGCPDVVSLQEFGPHQKEQVPPRVHQLCDGQYREVFEDQKLFDEQYLLTTLPVESSEVIDLKGDFRTATIVRLRAGERRVLVASTHTDDFVDECRGDWCTAPVCAGETSLGVCQVRRLRERLEQVAVPEDLIVINGDLNQKPDSPGPTMLRGDGYVDAWTAAGNPECDPATGRGCTCCYEAGERGAGVGGLDDPTLRPTERIDYVFVRPPAGCELQFDGQTDDDRDQTRTGPFAHEPAPAQISPGGPVWTSDHGGVALDVDVRCGA